MILDKLNPFKSSKKEHTSTSQKAAPRLSEPEGQEDNSLQPAKSTSSIASSLKSIGRTADRIVFLHNIPAPQDPVVNTKAQSPNTLQPTVSSQNGLSPVVSTSGLR